MRTWSVSGRLTLSILLLLYGDQLAAKNEGVCKKQNHDAYVPSNDLSCQEDVSHNEPFERYRPAKKSCASDFDTTGTLSLVFPSLITIVITIVKFHFLGNA